MSDKQVLTTGDTIKIERTANGWKTTVSGVNNSWHANNSLIGVKTFDEALEFVTSNFETK